MDRRLVYPFAVIDKRDADVIIVGAGPAGCAAARKLADRGVGVLLLEARAFPRWKPCAGGIPAARLDLVPAELHGLIETWVDRSKLTLNSTVATEVRAERPVGALVHRERFDHEHARLAGSLPGVSLEESCRVQRVEDGPEGAEVETSGGRLRARVVIGADGVESVTSRALPRGRDRRFMVAYELETEPVGTPGAVEFDFSVVAGGYFWVVPKRETSSIGGFVAGRRGPHLRDAVEMKVRDMNIDVLRRRGCRGPVGGTRRPLHGHSVVLAGDAADTVDPVSGEGIVPALASGEMAADAAYALLAEGRPLDGHTRRLRRAFHRDFGFARPLAGLLYGHPHRAFSVLFRSPPMCRWMASVVRGDLDYRGLALRAALSAPLLAVDGLRRRPPRMVVSVGRALATDGTVV